MRRLHLVSNEKAETLTHFIIKMLIYKILKERKSKPFIESSLGSHGFVDVADWKTGLMYEVQSKKNIEVEKEKARKYLLYAGVKDVIFISTKDFKTFDIREIKKQLELMI